MFMILCIILLTIFRQKACVMLQKLNCFINGLSAEYSIRSCNYIAHVTRTMQPLHHALLVWQTIDHAII